MGQLGSNILTISQSFDVVPVWEQALCRHHAVRDVIIEISSNLQLASGDLWKQSGVYYKRMCSVEGVKLDVATDLHAEINEKTRKIPLENQRMAAKSAAWAQVIAI